MTIIQAIILGIVQGITEFFPISSSAHLIAYRFFMNIEWDKATEIVIDTALHFGTLLAIGIYFFKDFIKMFMECYKFKGKDGKKSFNNLKQEGKIFWFIVIGSVPAAIIGLLFKKLTEPIRENIIVIGIALAVMGVILYFVDKKCKKETTMENLTLKQAVLIGSSQVLAALVPGFSRSGTTMTVARATKMERESAAKFSFLLGAPAIAGAALLAFVEDFSLAMLNFPFVLAVLVSFVVGLIAIKTLMEIVKKIGYEVFAIYRVLLGVALIVTYLVRL
ncbi:MAG: undecaprenyl-diphosphate phosphatase [Clostridia bacterium]|nr:undecaprenyl-diphosphate phosphatase [Clostridia bacterium]